MKSLWRISAVVLASLAAMVLSLALSASAQEDSAAPTFADEPEAHAVYDAMNAALRNAESLYIESDYSWEAKGENLGTANYKMWLKKPNFTLIEASSGGVLNGILNCGGGEYYIRWPSGKPRYGFETDERYEPYRENSYMVFPSRPGGDSIAHMTDMLGVGMSMTIVEASIFHGARDGMDKYFDSVRRIGKEKIAGEMCDVIEASYMKGQRTRMLWISQRDRIPRRLREVVHVDYDITVNETWSNVQVNGAMDDSLFAWKPPAGWKPWAIPQLEDGLLKPGTPAPDFDLATMDGGRFKLSEQKGKAVLIVFWRVG